MKIDVATQFSDKPFGRFPKDGPNNGQRFREEVLLPNLRENAVVNIDFDGVKRGIGSSFLEEAFGGIVRAGYPVDQLRERLVVSSSRSDYEVEIWGHIERAAKELLNKSEF